MSYLTNPYRYVVTPATYTLLWQNTVESSLDDNQSEIYYANEFDTNTAVIGEVITKITIKLKKVGTPTATVHGNLWLSATNLADNPSLTSNETYGAGDIGTSLTSLEFTFSGNTTDTLQGFKAGFTFSGAGDGSNHYQYSRNGSSAVDGTFGVKAKDLVSPAWLTPSGGTTCLTNGVYKSP